MWWSTFISKCCGAQSFLNCFLIWWDTVTEDGSTDTVPQILYGQYLILGGFGSCIFQTKKSKFFCRKDNQLLFPMDKGLTVPKQCLQFGQKYPKCLIKFRPNLSAQAQKFQIFEKKLSLDVRCPCISLPCWFEVEQSWVLFDVARTYLQLPLWQWGAGNVYLLVLSS